MEYSRKYRGDEYLSAQDATRLYQYVGAVASGRIRAYWGDARTPTIPRAVMERNTPAGHQVINLGTIPESGIALMSVGLVTPPEGGGGRRHSLAPSYPFISCAWKLAQPMEIAVSTPRGSASVAVEGGWYSISKHPAEDDGGEPRMRVLSCLHEPFDPKAKFLLEMTPNELAAWTERYEAAAERLAPGMGYFVINALNIWAQTHYAPLLEQYNGL